MLPNPQNIAGMFNQGLQTATQAFFAPLNMLTSMIGGGQFPEGIIERRDQRDGITPTMRGQQEERIKEMTNKAGIYVYVRPDAPAGSKGSIIF